jgi:hypothetical protein
MPDWLLEAIEGLLEWFQAALEGIRQGLISFLVDMDWMHLSDLSWVTGQPLASEFLTIAYVGYALVIVVGGFIVMSHESIQTRYTIREIAPRLVAGLLLAGLSATIVQLAMDVNNDIVDGFSVVGFNSVSPRSENEDYLPNALDPQAWWNAEADYQDCVEDSSEEACADIKPLVMVDILWILATIACLLVLIITSFIRNIAFFFVVVCAPVALACHGLPMTEWAARMWWRMLGACMASSIGQAALVWVYLSMTDSFYWGHLFHVQVVDWYLLVIVWMMWKVHQSAFHIARGRPLSIPGSRFLGALVMSKGLDMMSGRSRNGLKGNGDPKRRQQRPATPDDRFPDLPNEPEGFGQWAANQQQLEAHPANRPRPNADTSANNTGTSASPVPPVSPMGDAAPVGRDGNPINDNASPRSFDAGGPVQRPNPKLAPPTSPFDDAAPDEAATAAATKTSWSNDSLATVPDGTLLPPKNSDTAVRVRPDEAQALTSRRNEAELDHWVIENDQAEHESRARTEAKQRQAELRANAKAAMARMAAAGGKSLVAVKSAGPAQTPPIAAPPTKGGEQ